MNNNIRFEKEYVYLALHTLITKNPEQITICMPELIPIISNDVNDVNPAIKKNAAKALDLLFL